jgi:hypothetical protein
MVGKEETSFLKKRSKKLLFPRRLLGAAKTGIPPPERGIKSFLVLFFKKERLACCPSEMPRLK